MEDPTGYKPVAVSSNGLRTTSIVLGKESRESIVTTGGGGAARHSVIGVSVSDGSRKTTFASFRQSGGSQKLASPRAARRSIYAKAAKLDKRAPDGSLKFVGIPVGGGSSMDQSEGEPEKSLAFHTCLIRRHDEFWSNKISVRSDTEPPPEILCVHYDISEKNLFLGLSTGTLMVWKDAFEPATSSDAQSSSNNDHTVIKAKEHSGAISSLVFVRTLAPDRALRDDCKNQRNEQKLGVPASATLQGALVHSRSVEHEGGFLFTGSADRNIKLWVVEPRRLACVRTLCFHGGTVVSLAFCFPYLFSASTDGTVLICRADPTTGSLKYPQFTVAERIFAHSIYHPSTKLVLSNKQAWYDSLAVRCNGDRICLYCGATDGSLLVLDNTQTNVPAKPVVGRGGAPPINLHTQQRATVWSEARERASTALGRGRLYSSLLCNTSCWGSIIGQEAGEDVGHQGKHLTGAASPARDTIQSVAVAVPFRLQNKLTVHALGLRQVYALPLESAVATLGGEASISVVDPVAGQTSWKEENPEGCCYSACAWISSLNLLLVGDDYGCLSFYNIYSKERVHSQRVTEHRIVSLCLASNALHVVVGTAHELLLVELVEAAEEVALTGHQGHHIHINSVTGMCCWRPTSTAKLEDRRRSKVVTIADSDDVNSNVIEHSGIRPNGEHDMASTPPIYQVLTCGYDGRLNVTEIRADAETGEITTKFVDGITCLSSAGVNLISGSLDKSIRIWDVDGAECTRVLNNQPEPICCIVPLNEDYIDMWAGISSSGLVCVWDSSCHLVLSKTIGESIGCCVCVGKLGQLFLGTGKGQPFPLANYISHSVLLSETRSLIKTSPAGPYTTLTNTKIFVSLSDGALSGS
ncbi:hypothetical protein NCLIV_007870 [Neospora caninum Liverpool]|uniref:Uncharacterized protein n=1 Tax=Neospora caninum (strain Liverpool) TaxID=572307 RepID=F0V988_NEOCL|nr:hypothetical protein NCLIV_007870 [Neospora caninum Liverpool]CBZ50313.1 hypothetical protein NCLIV_007870 [Neospora caninum Liverpool]CEL64919.1 TPA: hypothetical protein BN1204_007870 [Neospora caninum Liverpool]|eukprot:XP_003880347.1 hypothetical protein NCLIV_007870 [Neospora caninum Liverpool]